MEEKTIKKIGIMGGTFNPIHTGHLLLAETARDTHLLDLVLFLPSGNSYMKDAVEIADKESRVEMTRLAISDNPHFGLSLLEVGREGESYTYETLLALRKAEPESDYFFITGADCLFTIETWKCPELIFQNCTLLAAVRDDKNTNELIAQITHLKNKFKARIHLLPMKEIGISSTDIREKIKQGQSIRYMVPQKVIAYLETHHLYC